MSLFDRGEDVVPEGLNLRVFESGLVMHSELDGIDFGKDFQEALKRGLGIWNQIVCSHAPHQARRSLAGVFGCARDTTALHAPSINVIPDAGGNSDASLVRDGDHGFKRSCVARLLFGG